MATMPWFRMTSIVTKITIHKVIPNLFRDLTNIKDIHDVEKEILKMRSDLIICSAPNIARLAQ